jgi:hypothetical protein
MTIESMLNLIVYSSGEFKAVIRLVWVVVTLATLGAAAVPFLLSAETISRLVPMCESKRRYGRECFLCGTTTGFIAISQGDWDTAARSNRLAIPLFGLFLANAGIAMVYFGLRARALRAE